MSDTTPAPASISPEETALLIIRQKGFVNTGYTAGSILVCDKQAWRYQDDRLMEVPWSDYEKAFNSADRNDWPPYTISFARSPSADDGTVTLNVTTDYDMGMCDDSRGGNETTWTLKHEDGEWQVVDVQYVISWD